MRQSGAFTREDDLWRSCVDWIAGAGVGEQAAVEVAGLLESVGGRPVVAVRGPVGIGVGEVASVLAGRGRAAGWRVVADEGPAPRVDADAVVTVSADPRAAARPGEVVVHPRGRSGCGIPLDDVPATTPAGPDPLTDAVAQLVAPAALGETRRGRLRRGLAEIAAAHVLVRDELEELLWP